MELKNVILSTRDSYITQLPNGSCYLVLWIPMCFNLYNIVSFSIENTFRFRCGQTNCEATIEPQDFPILEGQLFYVYLGEDFDRPTYVYYNEFVVDFRYM